MLRLVNKQAWSVWSAGGARPSDIPSTPQRAYAGFGWQSWEDWLGKPRYVVRKEWPPFVTARAFVHTLRLPNMRAWQLWSKSGERPTDIPSDPNQVYAGIGWQSWEDWLGKPRDPGGGRRRSWRQFEAARTSVQKLRLRSRAAWRIWCKSGQRPADIPSNPQRTYATCGWRSWTDWLGQSEREPPSRLGGRLL